MMFDNCETAKAHTTYWKVLADNATSILPVECDQVTLLLIESIKQ